MNFTEGNPAKVWESLNSLFQKKTRSFHNSFFRCSVLNFEKWHSHRTRGGRAQEWQGPFRMVRWLHVWGMWLGAVAAYRMAWEFGSMGDVHKLYRLQWSACRSLLQALASFPRWHFLGVAIFPFLRSDSDGFSQRCRASLLTMTSTAMASTNGCGPTCACESPLSPILVR